MAFCQVCERTLAYANTERGKARHEASHRHLQLAQSHIQSVRDSPWAAGGGRGDGDGSSGGDGEVDGDDGRSGDAMSVSEDGAELGGGDGGFDGWDEDSVSGAGRDSSRASERLSDDSADDEDASGSRFGSDLDDDRRGRGNSSSSSRSESDSDSDGSSDGSGAAVPLASDDEEAIFGGGVGGFGGGIGGGGLPLPAWAAARERAVVDVAALSEVEWLALYEHYKVTRLDVLFWLKYRRGLTSANALTLYDAASQLLTRQLTEWEQRLGIRSHQTRVRRVEKLLRDLRLLPDRTVVQMAPANDGMRVSHKTVTVGDVPGWIKDRVVGGLAAGTLYLQHAKRGHGQPLATRNALSYKDLCRYFARLRGADFAQELTDDEHDANLTMQARNTYLAFVAEHGDNGIVVDAGIGLHTDGFSLGQFVGAKFDMVNLFLVNEAGLPRMFTWSAFPVSGRGAVKVGQLLRDHLLPQLEAVFVGVQFTWNGRPVLVQGGLVVLQADMRALAPVLCMAQSGAATVHGNLWHVVPLHDAGNVGVYNVSGRLKPLPARRNFGETAAAVLNPGRAETHDGFLTYDEAYRQHGVQFSAFWLMPAQCMRRLMMYGAGSDLMHNLYIGTGSAVRCVMEGVLSRQLAVWQGRASRQPALDLAAAINARAARLWFASKWNLGVVRLSRGELARVKYIPAAGDRTARWTVKMHLPSAEKAAGLLAVFPLLVLGLVDALAVDLVLRLNLVVSHVMHPGDDDGEAARVVAMFRTLYYHLFPFGSPHVTKSNKMLALADAHLVVEGMGAYAWASTAFGEGVVSTLKHAMRQGDMGDRANAATTVCDLQQAGLRLMAVKSLPANVMAALGQRRVGEARHDGSAFAVRTGDATMSLLPAELFRNAPTLLAAAAAAGQDYISVRQGNGFRLRIMRGSRVTAHEVRCRNSRTLEVLRVSKLPVLRLTVPWRDGVAGAPTARLCLLRGVVQVDAASTVAAGMSFALVSVFVACEVTRQLLRNVRHDVERQLTSWELPEPDVQVYVPLQPAGGLVRLSVPLASLLDNLPGIDWTVLLVNETRGDLEPMYETTGRQQ